MTKRTFEEWKSLLQEDCKRNKKSAVFDALGEYVLKLLWQSGIEPTVRAIGDGSAHEAAGNETAGN